MANYHFIKIKYGDDFDDLNELKYALKVLESILLDNRGKAVELQKEGYRIPNVGKLLKTLDDHDNLSKE